MEVLAEGARKLNPLKKGYSQATMNANIAKMMREGYTQDRAVAAAYRSARAAWRSKNKGKPYPSHLMSKKTGVKVPKRKMHKRNPPLTKARRAVRTGRVSKPKVTREATRKVNPARRGYVVATLAPSSDYVLFHTGSGWGMKKDAAVFSTIDNASKFAMANGPKRQPVAVASVNSGSDEIRAFMLK